MIEECWPLPYGNLSYRLNDERIVITPSGVAKAFIKVEDLCIIDLQGRILEGKPSGEMSMHLEVLSTLKGQSCCTCSSSLRSDWVYFTPSAFGIAMRMSERNGNLLGCWAHTYRSHSDQQLWNGRGLGSFSSSSPFDDTESARRFKLWGEDLDEAVNGMGETGTFCSNTGFS
ncbi:MAG: class II aldolase/adducin family protein [Bdellovibrionales bacterium]|nr:class II aldolase/adducin family protein [Bdellovibrionales bacterium]